MNSIHDKTKAEEASQCTMCPKRKKKDKGDKMATVTEMDGGRKRSAFSLAVRQLLRRRQLPLKSRAQTRRPRWAWRPMCRGLRR